MALINCEDCGKEVSTRASVCPSCGGPIAGDQPNPTMGSQSVASTNTNRDGKYVTTQTTSKSLKGQQIAAGVLLAFGISMIVAAPPGYTPTIGALCTGVGLFWFLGARIASWWQHG